LAETSNNEIFAEFSFWDICQFFLTQNFKQINEKNTCNTPAGFSFQNLFEEKWNQGISEHIINKHINLSVFNFFGCYTENVHSCNFPFDITAFTRATVCSAFITRNLLTTNKIRNTHCQVNFSIIFKFNFILKSAIMEKKINQWHRQSLREVSQCVD
jgi:hypothetical protein